MHVSSAKPCRRLHLEVLRCAFHEETLNTLRKRRMKEKNERESNCLTVPSTDVSSLARPHLSPRFSSHRPKLFVPFFRPVSSDRALSPSLPLPPAAPRLFLFPPPSPPFHFIVLFFFFLSLRHLASNPSLAAGTLKGLAAPSDRKERERGHSSEAFSNRIPHCRLGNSRRIEITHYPVMSGAFTSTQGCTQRWSRVHTCFFAYTRPRHATMLHLHSHRS